MLRKNSTRSQDRRPLSRSKSSVTIGRNTAHALTGSEPLAVERDAYIAATLSFNRAQPQNHNERKSPRLVRQQSVRFAGPNAQPRRILAARASVPAASNLPRHPMGSQQYSLEPEDEAASLTSYGKLRKSKSMYAPAITKISTYSLDNSDHSDVFNGWQTTSRYSSFAKKENEPIWSSGGPSLRAPKSMAFLSHGREGSISRTNTRISSEMSDELTRNGFYEPPGSLSRLKTRPSSFFRSNYKQSPHLSAFPKSLRSSSNNTTVLSPASLYGLNNPSSIPPKQPTLRTTARKISKSLKSRIKGLFGRPKSTDEAIDQAEYHTPERDSNDGSCYGTQSTVPTRSSQEASMYQGPSRMPSFHAVPASQQLKSRQGSFANVEIEDCPPTDDKSRVTSWTDSTAATITHQPRSANWSRQYAFSSEAAETGTLPSSHKQASIPFDSNSHRGPAANSQRVYSALIKRLQETKQRQNQSLGGNHETLDASEADSPQSNSTIRRQPRWIRYEGSTNTIRHVQEEDDVFQDRAENTAISRSSSSNSVIRGHESTDSPQKSLSRDDYPNAAIDGECMAPLGQNATELQVAPETQKSLISSRSSAFFASPTCHLFRTTSPYRRALQATMKATQADEQPQTPGTRYLSSLSALSLPTRRSSTDGSDDDERMAYAESVYSNSNDKNIPSPSKSMRQTPMKKDHGDVTIFLPVETQRPSLSLSARHAREVSSSSSIEWKTWLSANVSKLEASSTTLRTDFPEEASSAPRHSKHIREKTEIEPKGDDLLQDVLGSGLPLRVAADKNNSPSALTTVSQPPKFQLANPWYSQSPVVNENSPPVTGRTVCSKDTSPVGSKGNMRTIPSVPNVNTCVATNIESSLEIPRMRSLNTLAKPCSPMSDEMRLRRQSRTRLRANDASAKSSPGLTTAFERQFGVSKTGSPGMWKAKEQSGKEDSTPRCEVDAGIDDMGRRELDAQVMGSKRMVDLFLSSRRKRTASSQMGRSSDSLSAAFI
ncbi:uncharacterized protein TrAtP1_012148 [Trichoderma atroviride]|uniref:uncharacterized protein n=1 Tax=Hypocrea atroviridis TaxID=63577 RepID=UPI003327CD2B|nr:hypothetical protein TrAtP1_012148 [Trichoderma atroviride]